jgi:hypothetical protein
MRRRPAYIRQSNEPRPVNNPSFNVRWGDYIRVRGVWKRVGCVIDGGTDKEQYITTAGEYIRERIVRAEDFEIGQR